jgi:hypothetical protein
VDPVPDPLLFSFSGSAGNRTRASGSVAKNSEINMTTVGIIHIYKPNNETSKTRSKRNIPLCGVISNTPSQLGKELVLSEVLLLCPHGNKVVLHPVGHK